MSVISTAIDPNLLTGIDDDAAVYRLKDDIAIIVTIDYFTPIVKEAYMYGQIAAANALSDVYAMGGRPVLALNVVCFPISVLGLTFLEEVLRGGADKLVEAGVTLAGGHSVIDPQEIKYGLSVVGVVNPNDMLTKGNLKKGDKIILTKALGTGIVNNALKGGLLDEETEKEVTESMALLNMKASRAAVEHGVRACTDVTGFGLAGHLMEMIEASPGMGARIYSDALPLFSRVEEFSKMGLIPPGTRRNRKFRGENVVFKDHVPDWKKWVLFDAQTSGGLLLSVGPEGSDDLLKRLLKDGHARASVIGEVIEDPNRHIEVV